MIFVKIPGSSKLGQSPSPAFWGGRGEGRKEHALGMLCLQSVSEIKGSKNPCA